MVTPLAARSSTIYSFVYSDFKSLLMSLLLASEESASAFPSTRHLSSSGSYSLDLSDLGDPTGSNAMAGLAVSCQCYRNPRASPPGQGGDSIGWVMNIVCV